ncbi:Mfa1 family fimbria major subunit [Phocaeicola barnesiae]|uniref:Mfa1 family fimbria major subunit n=1 Tax=Phocaeicola barnesiae TaxID=376804 RepID=UPI0025A362EE|nr:Mfa1 family fimbria major subunit [Phocaeicola barnesiae]MDM8233545.1 Mfa1 family fimbria major subunit [Phocaeicola barnesiae]
MKKNLKNMAWMLAATLMMAACSDSLDESSGNGNDLNTDGTGYVKIALNLPSTSGASTRADNDSFNDGLAAEYNVNDVILALFYGADESSATYKWATQLPNLNFVNQGTSTDNITTKSNYVVSEVPKPSTGEKVFALAIVNNSGYFSVSNNKLNYNAAGTNPSTEFSGTFAALFTTASNTDLTKIASTTANENKGNFMMTNAPIAKQSSVTSTNTTGWNPDITTLVELKVYDDKPTAEAAPSNPIYVERVVAKVNVKVNASSNTLTIPDETFKDATVEFTGWELQNTNKLTYLVRNVGSGNQAAWKTWITYFSDQTASIKENRFVGTQPDPYRTYWGIDPNYNTIVKSGEITNNFNVWSETSAPQKWLELANNGTTAGLEAVAYCAENTTIAKVMQKDQLTGILLKATFKLSGTDGVDFFTCNGVNQIYTKENMLAALTAELAASSKEDVKLGENEKLAIKEDAGGAEIKNIEDLKKVFQITGGTTDPNELSDDQANVILNKYSTINFYKGGRTYYYATLIKHFGEEYTPASGVNSLDNYSEKDHLGRYGVLRNNWYELLINSVSGPGDPEIPVIPEEPADKEHRYINCEINVLSWAKRSQGVDL